MRAVLGGAAAPLRCAARRRRAASAAASAGAMADAAPFRTPFRPEDHRACVGVVLLDASNRAFVAKRADGKALSGPPPHFLWQFPQGGIDKGEEPLAAAKRELYEETGVKSAELLAELPDWLSYQFPPEQLAAWVASGKMGFGGKYRGQAQRWFIFRFTGTDAEVDISGIGHKAEFVEWRWAALDDDIVQQVVPFKRRVYGAVLEAAKMLAAARPSQSAHL